MICQVNTPSRFASCEMMCMIFFLIKCNVLWLFHWGGHKLPLLFLLPLKSLLTPRWWALCSSNHCILPKLNFQGTYIKQSIRRALFWFFKIKNYCVSSSLSFILFVNHWLTGNFWRTSRCTNIAYHSPEWCFFFFLIGEISKQKQSCPVAKLTVLSFSFP